MDELVARIRAALDRAEEIAKACIATDWRMPAAGYVVDRDVDGWRSIPDESRIFSFYDDREAEAWHAVNNDPDTVLRRVAADRKILELHEGSHECTSEADNCVWITGEPGDDCATVLALAEAYGIEVTA